MNFYASYPVKGGSGGVTSVDGITGAITLVAGTGITITDNSPSAGDITISATGGGGGANTALSNLVSTAINQSLLPDTDQAYDLGNDTFAWNSLSVDGIKQPGANVFVVDIGNLQLEDAAGTPKLIWGGTDVSINSHKLTNVVDPTNPQDAATKAYVDAITSSSQVVETRTITSGEETAKAIVLAQVPTAATDVIFDVQGGPEQMYSFDYTVSGNTLSWASLGLDGILTAGDVVRILYWV